MNILEYLHPGSPLIIDKTKIGFFDGLTEDSISVIIDGVSHKIHKDSTEYKIPPGIIQQLEPEIKKDLDRKTRDKRIQYLRDTVTLRDKQRQEAKLKYRKTLNEDS